MERFGPIDDLGKSLVIHQGRAIRYLNVGT